MPKQKMTFSYEFLFLCLMLAIMFIYLNNKISAIEYMSENNLGEAEIKIYQSINNNTDLIMKVIESKKH